jgi:electron transport complex protein RnfE
MNQYTERIYNGLIKENPAMVMILGMCPTLATTTTVINGVGMGLSTTVVLVLANVVISLLRKVIPDEVRIPAFIVVIASLVTVVDFLMQGYFPALSQSLGVYIPLIVVNCIILGRAEAFASKNSVGLSFFDGLGMGLGFTFALAILGSIRELIGSGTWAGMQVMPKAYVPISIFVLQPGAFFALGCMIAVMTAIISRKKKTKTAEQDCNPADCAGCASSAHCGKRIFEETAKSGLKEDGGDKA